MGSSIRMRVEKLEGLRGAATSLTAVWQYETFLHAELLNVIKTGDPTQRAVAQEIRARAKDRNNFLSDLSTPALDLLKTLFLERAGTGG